MTFAEETNRPDFLPKKPHSWEDLRRAVRSNLDATVNLIPHLPLGDLKLQTLEQLEPGTYILPARPTVPLLRELPRFKGGTVEVGISAVNGKWLVTLGIGLSIRLPETLVAVEHDGLFQADLHTHPGKDPGSTQPSREDVDKLDSTIDGRNYIISSTGIHEFHRPTSLPGGFTELHDEERAWRYWIVNGLKLSEEEYYRRGGWELKRQFHEKFFGLRTISWNHTEEIEELLASKEELELKK